MFFEERNWNANKEIAVVVCTFSRLHTHTHTSSASSTTFSVFALRSENNKTLHVGCLFLRPCRHRVRVGRWEHCLFLFFTNIRHVCNCDEILFYYSRLYQLQKYL
jgi:hypothetical protein